MFLLRGGGRSGRPPGREVVREREGQRAVQLPLQAAAELDGSEGVQPRGHEGHIVGHDGPAGFGRKLPDDGAPAALARGVVCAPLTTPPVFEAHS